MSAEVLQRAGVSPPRPEGWRVAWCSHAGGETVVQATLSSFMQSEGHDPSNRSGGTASVSQNRLPDGLTPVVAIYLIIYIGVRISMKHNQKRSNMRNPVFGVALLLIGVVSAGSAPLQAACPGGVSTSFEVSGDVTNRAVFDLNKLERFPPAQANLTYFAAGSVVTEAFTGRAALGPPEQLAG